MYLSINTTDKEAKIMKAQLAKNEIKYENKLPF